MSDDQPQSCQLNFVNGVVDGRRNGEFIEFHQEIILLTYAKGRGLLLECHQIFWTPMEIASRGKLYPVTNRALQIGRRLLHRRKIKTVFVVGVRRGNDVRNPISN